jgi:hypothetical protein
MTVSSQPLWIGWTQSRHIRAQSDHVAANTCSHAHSPMPTAAPAALARHCGTTSPPTVAPSPTTAPSPTATPACLLLRHRPPTHQSKTPAVAAQRKSPLGGGPPSCLRTVAPLTPSPRLPPVGPPPAHPPLAWLPLWAVISCSRCRWPATGQAVHHWR